MIITGQFTEVKLQLKLAERAQLSLIVVVGVVGSARVQQTLLLPSNAAGNTRFTGESTRTASGNEDGGVDK